ESDAALTRSLRRFTSARPSETLGGRLEHGAKSRLLELPQPKLERIDIRLRGELVHETLACEDVRGRCERAVGALSKRRVPGTRSAARIGDRVRRLDRGAARVVVRLLPGDEASVRIEPGGEVDHARGAKVGPGELLLAGPAKRDGSPRGPSQPRRLERRLARVLAAERAARVGND